jgi:predicted dehydrogenase
MVDSGHLKLGILGGSPNNGHPFSFSSIINSYAISGYRKSGWDVILDYLEARDPVDIGINGVSVTHAWTDNPALTQVLCEASNIPNQVDEFEQMVQDVDAAMILRDDFVKHKEYAFPFLEAGKPIFIDKPLALDEIDLRYFLKYVSKGQCMSCSGLRYTTKLDNFKYEDCSTSRVSLIHGLCVGDWNRYAIHLLDAIKHKLNVEVDSVMKSPLLSNTFELQTKQGIPIVIHTNCHNQKKIELRLFSDGNDRIVGLNDNFDAFKRTILRFIEMIQTGNAPIPPQETAHQMKVLRAGNLPQKTLDIIDLENLNNRA